MQSKFTDRGNEVTTYSFDLKAPKPLWRQAPLNAS